MKTLVAIAILAYVMSHSWIYPTQGGVSFGLGSLGYHYQYVTTGGSGL